MPKLTKTKKKGSFPRKISKKVSKNTQKKPHFNIVYCTPGRKLPDTFPYILMDSEKAGYKCAHIKLDDYNPNIYLARTQYLGNNALDPDIHRPLFNNKCTYDRIIWIDDDNTPTFQHIFRLIKQDVDIVAGMYHMKCRDKFATVENGDFSYYEKHGQFNFLTDKDVEVYRQIAKRNGKETEKGAIVDGNGINIKHYLMPVFYSGFGCMVIKQGVFEKIGYPYFAPEFFKLSNGVTDFCGEDVSFCIKAKRAGYQPYVDTGVIFLHDKNYLV